MKKTNAKIESKGPGRPAKLKSIDIEQLRFLVERGCTDGEICAFFKIDHFTWLMQQSRPEIKNIMKDWKKFADERIYGTLLKIRSKRIK